MKADYNEWNSCIVNTSIRAWDVVECAINDGEVRQEFTVSEAHYDPGERPWGKVFRVTPKGDHIYDTVYLDKCIFLRGSRMIQHTDIVRKARKRK